MKKVLLVLTGVFLLLGGAAGLAYTTLASSHAGLASQPSASVEPTSAPEAVVVTPAPATATPAPTRQATANAMVHLRVGPSASTGIMTDIPMGAPVVLGSYSDSQWQQAVYNGLNGYVFKSYLNY